jgi:Uma2 family endonuclease
LWDGELWEKMGQGAHHIRAVYWLSRWLREAESEAWTVISETNVRVGSNLPEPDVTLLRGDPEQALASIPASQQVALAIEITVSSDQRDSADKPRRYAEAGVLEYWQIDVAGERALIYRSPELGWNQSRTLARPGDSLSPAALPDIEIDVRELFRLIRAAPREDARG